MLRHENCTDRKIYFKTKATVVKDYHKKLTGTGKEILAAVEVVSVNIPADELCVNRDVGTVLVTPDMDDLGRVDRT